jgi:hypothetical protein
MMKYCNIVNYFKITCGLELINFGYDCNGKKNSTLANKEIRLSGEIFENGIAVV